MCSDDSSNAEQPAATESERESGSEPPATTDNRRPSRRARLAGDVALGLLVIAVSGMLAYFGDPGQWLRYSVFLFVSAPLLLGYRGTDASPRPLAGLAAFGAVFIFGTCVFDTLAAEAAVRLVGMDPISAQFAVEHGVDNAVILALLEATLWVWVLAPAAVELASDLSTLLPQSPGVSPRPVVAAFAVIVVAGTLSPAFLSGYHPVTTVETPSGTFEHDGVAATVTDVKRFDTDTPVSLIAGTLPRTDPASESGEIVLVRVQTHDRGTGDTPSLDVRLVTPAADEGEQVRERIDTVISPSGNPVFAGTETPARQVRVAEQNYTVYDPGDRTDQTNEGWILFRRPPGADAESYIRIQTGDPGPAGKWPLGSGG